LAVDQRRLELEERQQQQRLAAEQRRLELEELRLKADSERTARREDLYLAVAQGFLELGKVAVKLFVSKEEKKDS